MPQRATGRPRQLAPSSWPIPPRDGRQLSVGVVPGTESDSALRCVALYAMDSLGMPRLWILSDLHLEAMPYPERFQPAPRPFDVLVAAGDVWEGSVRRACARRPGPVRGLQAGLVRIGQPRALERRAPQTGVRSACGT